MNKNHFIFIALFVSSVALLVFIFIDDDNRSKRISNESGETSTTDNNIESKPKLNLEGESNPINSCSELLGAVQWDRTDNRKVAEQSNEFFKEFFSNNSLLSKAEVTAGYNNLSINLITPNLSRFIDLEQPKVEKERVEITKKQYLSLKESIKQGSFTTFKEMLFRLLSGNFDKRMTVNNDSVIALLLAESPELYPKIVGVFREASVIVNHHDVGQAIILGVDVSALSHIISSYSIDFLSIVNSFKDKSFDLVTLAILYNKVAFVEQNIPLDLISEYEHHLYGTVLDIYFSLGEPNLSDSAPMLKVIAESDATFAFDSTGEYMSNVLIAATDENQKIISLLIDRAVNSEAASESYFNFYFSIVNYFFNEKISQKDINYLSSNCAFGLNNVLRDSLVKARDKTAADALTVFNKYQEDIDKIYNSVVNNEISFDTGLRKLQAFNMTLANIAIDKLIDREENIENEKHLARIMENPEGVLPVIEKFNNIDNISPEDIIETYRESGVELDVLLPLLVDITIQKMEPEASVKVLKEIETGIKFSSFKYIIQNDDVKYLNHISQSFNIDKFSDKGGRNLLWHAISNKSNKVISELAKDPLFFELGPDAGTDNLEKALFTSRSDSNMINTVLLLVKSNHQINERHLLLFKILYQENPSELEPIMEKYGLLRQ